MYAIIYNPDAGRWERHSDPVEFWRTNETTEVVDVLAAAETAAEAGATVIGHVSYEAAPGFDPALPGGTGELACFIAFGTVTPVSPGWSTHALPEMAPSISREQYQARIAAIHDYLAAGDAYQVNLTFPLTGSLAGVDHEALFWTLFHRQPGSYAALIDTGRDVICSLSPELFFRREADLISTEPMKGTRPRRARTADDNSERGALVSSTKDRAENVMIVDMIRNDLGRIARTGSVQVDELFRIRETPTVWQMVSRISARTDADLAGIFGALFPCASITGAPKRRSMEIIRELEPAARGIYTGAIGWLREGRRACFSVAIRTLLIDKASGAASYGTGGGIVWDSEAAHEWQEALAKTAVLDVEAPSFALLETLCYQPGDGILLEERHIARLTRSAKYFGYPLDTAALRQELDNLGGDEALRVRLLLQGDGQIEIESVPLSPLPTPVRLRIAERPVSRHDIFLRHKTTHRRVYDQARQGPGDCDDVILWNEDGEVTETTICNLFIEQDGELLTPAVNAGLLPGTLREQLIKEGRAREAILTLDDLANADAIHVGNSVRGLLPAQLIATDRS